MKFKADEVYIQNDPKHILFIRFSGLLKGSPIYFKITDVYDRSDKLEIMRGMDTYYIEMNDQYKGGYGGICEVRLTKSLLLIVLHEFGRKNLDIESSTLEISLEMTKDKLMELQQKLKQIFEPEQGDRKVKAFYETIA